MLELVLGKEGPSRGRGDSASGNCRLAGTMRMGVMVARCLYWFPLVLGSIVGTNLG